VHELPDAKYRLTAFQILASEASVLAALSPLVAWPDDLPLPLPAPARRVPPAGITAPVKMRTH
jgi:hypothetical protein